MTTKAIQCHVRLRPPPDNDGKVNPEAINIEGNSISALSSQGDKRYHFSLDRCHDAFSSQEDVFAGIVPLLQQAYQGANATIFAYGVTGSGKTHTMQGTPSDRGIIYRTIDHVFNQAREGESLEVKFTYVEILKDEVYDLLGKRTEPKKCELRQSGKQVMMPDVTVEPVSSPTEFAILYEAAAKTRKTASTKLNSSSSRSHAILNLHLSYADRKQSKICLVDLAGSENNNLTGNDPERMRESSAINQSLTTLGKVVDALNRQTNARRRSSVLAGATFVPYRESKLTRLLQDALGGSSQGLLLCCLAPGEKFARDNINTLQFGTKAQSVENPLPPQEASGRASQSRQPKVATRTNMLAPISAQCAKSTVGPRASTGRTVLGSLSANTQQTRRATVDSAKVESKPLKKAALHPDRVLGTQPAQPISLDVASQMSGGVNESMVTTSYMVPGVQKGVVELHTELTSPPAVEVEAEEKALSDSEKENRARVLVAHARTSHQSGYLQQALQTYRKALEYVPSNRKLAMRITELELTLEGLLPTVHGPVTGPAGTKAQIADRGTENDADAVSRWGNKRGRGDEAGSELERDGPCVKRRVEVAP